MAESPQWKKPSDIMKKRRIKKRISIQRVPSTEPFATEVFGDKSENVTAQCKRRNPFSQNTSDNIELPLKRARLSSESNPDEVLSFFKNHGEQTKDLTGVQGIEIEKTPTQSFLREDEDSCSQFAFIEKIFNSKRNTVQTPNEAEAGKCKEVTKTDGVKGEASKSFPVDWSVKAKMRVVSSHPLTWCTQLKTTEEAAGVTRFVNGNSQNNSCDKAELKNCLLYWVYPSLPWMKMFPRIVPDNNIKRPSTDLLADEVQKPLLNEWTESFSSAFHQLRSQQCPYFYVCTHQFSVLFRAKGVAGNPSMCALLTPTTRGLRESLKNEDIEFSMPVLESKKRRSIESLSELEKENSEVTDRLKAEEDDEDLIDTDEGAHVWLESIGLDKKAFPSLDPNKVKIQREGFRVIDNRPESLVYVEGTNVHGLFNFLLNCRSCIATSGPQSGVPPTVLSPKPFIGGTLKSHKVKHSIARRPDIDGSVRQVHILEVAGPVLPHHVHTLSSLLQRTQNSDFSLTFNTHEPTYPFNVPCPSEDCSTINRQVLDMENNVYDSFFSGQSIADRLASIHELTCDIEGYTWLS